MPLDVQFECARGRTLALIGPSGAGKTTILRSIAGLYRPASGHIVCNGATWLDTTSGAARAPHERKIGFVFQSYALFPHLTAHLLFWQEPWEAGAFEPRRQGLTMHLFQRSLAGKEIDFNRLQGAWEAINDERLESYFWALPKEWAGLDASRGIVSYLARVRDNLPGALEQVRLLLR